MNTQRDDNQQKPDDPVARLRERADNMAKAISGTRKSRGRPSTGAESVHLRVLPDQSAAIDAWIKRQKEPDMSRPEAIRRLVELGLKAKGK